MTPESLNTKLQQLQSKYTTTKSSNARKNIKKQIDKVQKLVYNNSVSDELAPGMKYINERIKEFKDGQK